MKSILIFEYVGGAQGIAMVTASLYLVIMICTKEALKLSPAHDSRFHQLSLLSFVLLCFFLLSLHSFSNISFSLPWLVHLSYSYG